MLYLDINSVLYHSIINTVIAVSTKGDIMNIGILLILIFILVCIESTILKCSNKSIRRSTTTKLLMSSNNDNDKKIILLPSNQVKFNSEMLLPQVYSSNDLFTVSSKSFSSNDYFNDILKSNINDNDKDINNLFYLAVPSVLTATFIVPTLAIPDTIKNVLGLVLLFLPFVFILLSLLAPNLLNEVKKSDAAKQQGVNQEERILYHEAGHLLVGYLCGIPITDYSVNGDRDAGTNIDFNSIITTANNQYSNENEDKSSSFARGKSTLNEMNNNNNNKYPDKLGNLLVMAFAGIVSETLRFGLPAYGGREDISMCLFIMNKSKVQYEEQDGLLRWALSKSLIILRENRDLLDILVVKMKSNTPLLELFEVIESN